jgi:hypothetical protein
MASRMASIRPGRTVRMSVLGTAAVAVSDMAPLPPSRMTD